MEKLKVGDWVECIDFGGATGVYFTPGRIYRIHRFVGVEPFSKRELVEIEGIYTGHTKMVEAYVGRFKKRTPPNLKENSGDNTLEDTLEDILEAQDIYKSLIDG